MIKGHDFMLFFMQKKVCKPQSVILKIKEILYDGKNT